ncbi:MAG: glycosyltransferase family 61 protein [Candidatus Paceibacteria bacterium]
MADLPDANKAFNKVRKRALLPVQIREDICFWFKNASQIGGRLIEGSITLDKNILAGVPKEVFSGMTALEAPVRAPVSEFVLPAGNVGNFYVSTIRTAGRAGLVEHSFSNYRDMRLTVLSRRGEKVKSYLQELVEILYSDVFLEVRFLDELDIQSFISPVNAIAPSNFSTDSGTKMLARRVLRSSYDVSEKIRCLPWLPSRPDGSRIFISRKKAKSRKIVNEDELFSRIKGYGFISVCMEEYSLREQIEMVNGADFVIGPHGAGMAHMVSARPGASFIELSSRQYAMRAVNNFSPVAQSVGVNYHVLYCDEDGDSTAELVENEGNDIVVGEAAVKEITSIIIEGALADQ